MIQKKLALQRFHTVINPAMEPAESKALVPVGSRYLEYLQYEILEISDTSGPFSDHAYGDIPCFNASIGDRMFGIVEDAIGMSSQGIIHSFRGDHNYRTTLKGRFRKTGLTSIGLSPVLRILTIERACGLISAFSGM